MRDSLVCWGLLTSSVWDENGSTISLYPSIPHRYCCSDVRNFRKHTELINHPFTSEESERQTHYSEDWLGQCFLNSAPWPCLASVCYCCLSYVWLFWDPMNYSPPGSSIYGVSRQEYCSGSPCSPLGIFPTQGSNPCLLNLLHGQDSLPLRHLGRPSASFMKIFQ